jgi:transposase
VLNELGFSNRQLYLVPQYFADKPIEHLLGQGIQREDLKQWMLAVVTAGEGVPQFLQPLDGNASDKRALLEAVTALTQHLQDSGESPGVYVAVSGLYSTENMTQLNVAQVQWV